MYTAVMQNLVFKYTFVDCFILELKSFCSILALKAQCRNTVYDDSI